jgi:hypothetical protein
MHKVLGKDKRGSCLHTNVPFLLLFNVCYVISKSRAN